ncbi:DUF58 domain-containing protein [Aureimonas fodinaquatilis]|uniref:DUF58 domain-containing protein n=1 Tax=Aureimonas fodinaquatilis TaxID=2565783 RepID=A0A5B0DWC1_9HYPH|nr:DUF58 domain-containing protein [Aureimonas fodinaquatilis]KAA0969499.1 DUF58 domain-containing protein [Aureimonas fodinaquatilis]
MIEDTASMQGVMLDAGALLRLRAHAAERHRHHLAPTGRPGGFAGRRAGNGSETADLRLYLPGDDIRHLERSATARTGVPHVRTFHEELEKFAILIADFSPPMVWGTRRSLRSVVVAEGLALCGWLYAEEGARIGLLASADGEIHSVTPRAGARGMGGVVTGLCHAHGLSIAAALARHAAEPVDLSALLERAARVATTRSTLVLASSFESLPPEFERMVMSLIRRVRMVALVVCDAFELDPPAGTYPFATRQGGLSWGQVAKGKQRQGDTRVAFLERLGMRVIRIDAGSKPQTVIAELDRPHGQHR